VAPSRWRSSERGRSAAVDRLVWDNEAVEAVGGRFEGAVRRVLRERKAEVVAMVAHGTVISLLVARHNDIDAFGFWQKLGLPSSCALAVPGFELQEVPLAAWCSEPDTSYPTRSKCSTVGIGL
jgi:broad specificity phosphatase PhoE